MHVRTGGYWNEALSLPQHWTSMRISSMRAGPRRAGAGGACPTGALRALKVEDDEMRRIAQSERLEPLEPAPRTEPGALYRNLARYTRVFVAARGRKRGWARGLRAARTGAACTRR